MKEDIHTLQKTVSKLQSPSATPPPEPHSNSHSTIPTKTPKTPSDTNTNLKPVPRPSIIIHTAQFKLAIRPHPLNICATINLFLSRSNHSKVHISAAKWTTKGNITLTGGADNSLDQLLAAKSTIRQGLSARVHTPSTAQITANVKWSKILINNIPTGTSNTREAWTPQECHDALCTENPVYAALTITQKPSWVKPPNMYKPDSTSSLVVVLPQAD